MKRRSECHCSCHVKIDGEPMAKHVMACCEPDPCYVCDGKGSGDPDSPCPRCFRVGEVNDSGS
jgi:hypothetical protein